MSEISQPTQKLIQRYQSWHQSLQKKTEVPTVHVDEVASKVAAFYEKIRGVVDWKEEHLFRKTAIERVLKRRLFFQKNGEQIATPLVYELIRGGHFPNDTIEESKIEEFDIKIDEPVKEEPIVNPDGTIKEPIDETIDSLNDPILFDKNLDLTLR